MYIHIYIRCGELYCGEGRGKIEVMQAKAWVNQLRAMSERRAYVLRLFNYFIAYMHSTLCK